MGINKSIEDKSFYTKPNLLKTFARAKSKTGRLHFIGLVSNCMTCCYVVRIIRVTVIVVSIIINHLQADVRITLLIGLDWITETVF